MKLALGLGLLFAFVFASAQPKTALVPWPENVKFVPGSFRFTSATPIVADPNSPVAKSTAELLQKYLAKDAMAKCGIRSSAPGAAIRLRYGGDDLGEEGYRLVVDRTGIMVQASAPAGLFYGIQTVRQLVGRRLPAQVPYCSILDKPRFPWRGLLLDVSRHFRTKEFVKHYIDLLAFHKMNVFHWHIVDDQGWRLEVKRYPKLTEVGAWRTESGTKYGGFYTQNDVREVVAYAKKRFITVVPEIEMPGHCNAALASYPQYSCTGGPFNTPSLWGVFSDVYCPGNEETFAFVEGILEETLDLFPSKFIHIGGDEVPKTRWQVCPKCQARIKAEGLKDEHELQSYFIRRIDNWLTQRGRRLVGWDEILEGGLAQGATVQSWRGMQGAIDAAKMGHDVIVSPTSHCYLDYNYATTPVEKSYAFEPVPTELSSAEAKHVLGGEGNMWAELTPLPKDTDRQVFPRLSALCEVYWSPKAARNWNSFSERLSRHLDTLAAMGVKFYVPPPVIVGDENAFLDKIVVTLKSTAGEIVYTLDGSDPSARSPRYRGPITLTASAILKASTLRGGTAGQPVTREFKRVSLKTPVVFIRKPDPGLRYNYYEGTWTKLPDFGKLTPTKSGTTDLVDRSKAERTENYGLVLTGFFMALKDGIYTFYLSSDDGSDLWIGDERVIDHDGLHAPSEKSGQVGLKAGWHPIRVRMFQSGGDHSLWLEVRDPGGKRRKLAPDDFGQ